MLKSGAFQWSIVLGFGLSVGVAAFLVLLEFSKWIGGYVVALFS